MKDFMTCEEFTQRRRQMCINKKFFNSTQPHGIRANRSGDKVRIAQYISMMPAQEENEELRQWRINRWRNKVAPEDYAFPGDPEEREKKDPVAELTELRKSCWG